ncbi:hypothetical protein Tco_0005008, partial [Tanacetum coccineum]
FGVELFDMTGEDEKADGNFIEDTKELSIKMDVEIDTFIQKLLNRVSKLPKSSNKTGGIRAFEQETRDLDVEIKQMKELKASYGITTPHELRRNQVNEGMSQHPSYYVRIMQISQGNGQNRTNTDTGTEKVQKSQKIAINGQHSQSLVNIGQPQNDKILKIP